MVPTVLGRVRVEVAGDGPPGHGGSEPLSAGFSFGDCARTIQQILDELRFDSAHFVGNSWGGMIGATFAAPLPERARSCVLMNCTASPAGRRQRIEYGLLRRAAVLRGGLKPPLTRAAIDAFLGPTSRRSGQRRSSTSAAPRSPPTSARCVGRFAALF